MFQRDHGAREGSIQGIGQPLRPALSLQGRQQPWWRVIIICADADIWAIEVLVMLVREWLGLEAVAAQDKSYAVSFYLGFHGVR